METAETSFLRSAKTLHETHHTSENTHQHADDHTKIIYKPVMDALSNLIASIEAQHKDKIKELQKIAADRMQQQQHALTDKETALQTLSHALATKETTLLSLEHKNIELNQALQSAKEKTSRLETHITKIENTEKEKSSETIAALKIKIAAITEDFQQQVHHLEQKLGYETLKYSNGINSLTQECQSQQELSQQLKEAITQKDKEYAVLQKAHHELEEVLNSIKTASKKSSENTLRTEHNFKLLHEELERSRHYIKELEEKNNALQKELFDNWINYQENL